MSRTHEVVVYTYEPSSDPGIMTEIGIVEELATGKKVASIVYCKSMYALNGQHTSLQRNGQFCEYEIHLDNLYFGLMKRNELVFEAIMMHETGHIINGDYDKAPGGYDAMENRKKLVKENKVAEEELLADCFAAEQCGKKIAKAMLDQIINTRKSRGYGPDDLGIREAELRKKAINRL